MEKSDQSDQSTRLSQSNQSRDQAAKQLSLKVYPVVVGIIGLAIALLAIGRYWGSSGQNDPAQTADVDPSRLPADVPAAPSTPIGSSAEITGTDSGSSAPAATDLVPHPAASTSSNPERTAPSSGTDASTNSSSDIASNTADSDSAAISFGSNLRVSNQTAHPIRVALLPQKIKPEDSSDSSESSYENPVHWDFAPEEGSRQGLLLSLPDRDLQLQTGDVLIAFAQDGSRLYWGPYVVDETILPLWNEQTQEWQLVLTP